MSSISVKVLFAALVMVLATTGCFAQPILPSTDGWNLNIDSSSGQVNIGLTVDNLDELMSTATLVTRTWSNVSLGDSGAYLKSIELGVADPIVSLKFAVGAGSAITSFTINSALVSFTNIPLAQASATAGITVTDASEIMDGASANGLLSGGKFYQAQYMGSSWTNFAYLIGSPVTVVPGGTVTSSGASSPLWQNVSSVSDIKSQFSFNLSAFDEASGTSSFRIVAVPEPGSMLALLSGLIGCAGLVAKRKRA